MTDAYSHLVLGAPLEPRELQVITKGTVPECSEGHPQPKGGGAFCSQCGGKFVLQEVVGYIPAFRAYAEILGLEPKELFGEWEERRFHNVNGVTSSEDVWRKGEATLVFGEMLAESGGAGRGRRPQSVSLESLQDKVAEIQEILNSLGFKDREIKLYLSTYWSV
jgi:hypothetical protein